MRIIRLPETLKKTGYGRSFLYKSMGEGKFPKSVPLGKKAVGWIEEEVDAWILERIRERDADKPE